MVYRVHGGPGGEGTCIWAPALMPALKMFLTRVNTFLGCTNLSVTYVYGDVFISDFSIVYGLLRGKAQLLLVFKYLFLVVRGVRWCAGPFRSCRGQGCPSCPVRTHCSGFSCAEHRLQGACAAVVVAQGLSCSKTWGLPRSGVKPVSPKLADRIFTTEPLREVPKSYSLLSPASMGSHLTVRNID